MLNNIEKLVGRYDMTIPCFFDVLFPGGLKSIKRGILNTKCFVTLFLGGIRSFSEAPSRVDMSAHKIMFFTFRLRSTKSILQDEKASWAALGRT